MTLGILFIQTLNTLMPWRQAGLVCMFIPILTVIGLLLVRISLALHQNLHFKLTNCFSGSFQRLQFGFWQKIALRKLKKLCNGCAVGFQNRLSLKNFKSCNATVNVQNHAPIVSNTIESVHIQCQQFSKKFVNCGDHRQ